MTKTQATALAYPEDAQGIFDETARHLFAQGTRAMVMRTGSDDVPRPACAYRTPEGRMCAVGRHIRDEEYAPDMEFTSASFLVLPPRLAAHVGLLHALQAVHDDLRPWTSTETMRAALKRVAWQRSLSPDILSTLSFADGR